MSFPAEYKCFSECANQLKILISTPKVFLSFMSTDFFLSSSKTIM